MARRRWVRPASRRSQSEAGTMRGTQSVGWVLSPSFMPNAYCSSSRSPCASRSFRSHLFGARAFQLVEDRLVDPTQSSFRKEDLVCARQCALEPHRMGIILAPGRVRSVAMIDHGLWELILGEDADTQIPEEQAGNDPAPEGRATLLGSWISCAIGILLAAGTGRRRIPWRGREHHCRRAWRGLRGPWLLPGLQKTRDRDGLPLRRRHPLRIGRQPGSDPRHSTLRPRPTKHPGSDSIVRAVNHQGCTHRPPASRLFLQKSCSLKPDA